jgi:gluconolactonase
VSLRAISFALLIASPVIADDIFDPKSKLKVEAEKGVAGEGPAWHPELGILTSGNGHINRLSLDGKSTIHRKDAGTNGLLFDREGNLLACEPVLRRVTRTSPDGKITVLAEKHDGKHSTSRTTSRWIRVASISPIHARRSKQARK